MVTRSSIAHDLLFARGESPAARLGVAAVAREFFLAFVNEEGAGKTGVGNEEGVETFDFAEVAFDDIVGDVIGPIIVAGASLYWYPIAPTPLVVATMATEVDDEVVLFGDYIDEAVEGTADAFFGGVGVFDEGDVSWVEVVAGSEELDKGFNIADSVAEFGAMLILVDGDGQQVVGAFRFGGILRGSVSADEVAIGHCVVLGCFVR